MAKQNLTNAAAAAAANIDTGKFTVNDWTRLERFLILGTEGGHYHASAKVELDDKLLASTKSLERCIQLDGKRTVELIVNVSEMARAPKNDTAVFALAAAIKLGNDETRRLAYENLPKVVRTGTHLIQFMQFAKAFKKSGRGLRKAVANWYLTRTADQAAYQMLKYAQRDGMSQADILRLAHAGHYNGHKQEGFTAGHSALFKYVVDGELPQDQEGAAPKLLLGFIGAKELGAEIEKTGTKDETLVQKAVNYIKQYGLSREMIPTQFLKEKKVWEALLEKMPLTALIRNLGKMTSIELIEKGSDVEKTILERLESEEYLKKSRIHPIQILTAMKTYQSGGGHLGKLTWKPNAKVTKALDEAFYKAFINVPKTGLNYYVGVDCSGSMGSCFNGGNIQSIEAAMAMAMCLLHAEDKVHIAGYSAGKRGGYDSSKMMEPLDVSRKMYLTTACQNALKLNWGTTDCGLPYKDAMARGEKYDVFINITDNDHNTGASPKTALAKYRSEVNSEARQIVIGTVNSDFSIADPNDPMSLDISGFDAAIPAIVADFATGGKQRAEFDQEPESTEE
jgi:60 kDa SS-A/Ro ribonucleoprotein